MTHLLQIGPIPEWIKALRAPGYVNIFEIAEVPSIYGTEHLCGDWRGDLLLMAKDFAPVGEVRRLVDKGLSPEKVYRHNDGDVRYRTGLKTNSQLMRWLLGDQSLIDGKHALTCGATVRQRLLLP